MFNLSVSLKGTIQYQYIYSNFVVLCIVNTFAELVRSTEVSSLFRSRCFKTFFRLSQVLFVFVSIFLCSLIFVFDLFSFPVCFLDFLNNYFSFFLISQVSSRYIYFQFPYSKITQCNFPSGLQIVGRERRHWGSPPWAWFNRRTIIFYRFCSGRTK